MGPLLGLGLTSGIGALLNRLGAGAEHGRIKQLMAQLMALYNPQAMMSDTNNFYDAFKNSPMYQNMQSRAIAQSNNLNNQFSNSLGMSGLSRGAAAGFAGPLARASITPMMNQVDSQLFQQALSEARMAREGRAGVIGQYGGQGDISSLTIGHTMSDMSPMIYDYLKGLGTPKPATMDTSGAGWGQTGPGQYGWQNFGKGWSNGGGTGNYGDGGYGGYDERGWSVPGGGGYGRRLPYYNPRSYGG